MLRSLVWTQATTIDRLGIGTAPESKICIETVTKWNPVLVEKRPGVFVRRDSRTAQRIAFNDSGIQGFGNQPSKFPVDSGEKFQVLILGSYTVFCVARTGAEAEAIGTEVQLRLLEFAPLIREDLNLAKFSVMEMGPVSILEEAQQHFVTAVPVAYAFVHAWRLIPYAPILKTADIRPQE